MSYSPQASIALVEAAYNLHADGPGWFPSVLDAARTLLDDGLGVMGVMGHLPAPPATPIVTAFSGPNELLAMQARVLSELPDEDIREDTRTGVVIISDQNKDRPEHLAAWRRHLDAAQDGIGLTALDPDQRGLHFFAPTMRRIKVSPGERQQWQMLAAHLSAGLRLHGRLEKLGPGVNASSSSLPHGADAVIDPRNFVVVESAPSARAACAVDGLREAAIRVDRARGRLGKDDPQHALETWTALVGGRWSIIDWFDSDQRRYVVAVPNPPNVSNPRGLTEREGQVVSYAALGETHKLIGYRLGVSRARVTNHMRSAMRKLGVRTHAGLVEKMRAAALAFGPPQSTDQRSLGRTNALSDSHPRRRND